MQNHIVKNCFPDVGSLKRERAVFSIVTDNVYGVLFSGVCHKWWPGFGASSYKCAWCQGSHMVKTFSFSSWKLKLKLWLGMSAVLRCDSKEL